ncbi:Hypothetical protein NTJ_07546 [Nesidiocoris tenuis]|uniref:Uncharacterized protein n=1 Tax=Nesidiocoris tenuis TaxID=355587 RepID=A0ABN7ARA6_9HEMI|nr:Hypothetical protein NTJ_07546 [Nesidiocoris tenuis]
MFVGQVAALSGRSEAARWRRPSRSDPSRPVLTFPECGAGCQSSTGASDARLGGSLSSLCAYGLASPAPAAAPSYPSFPKPSNQFLPFLRCLLTGSAAFNFPRRLSIDRRKKRRQFCPDVSHRF